MIEIILGIGFSLMIFLAFLGPIFYYSRRHQNTMKIYMKENSSCVKCGEKLKLEYVPINMQTFKVFCNNEECENFGLRKTIDVDKVLKKEDEN